MNFSQLESFVALAETGSFTEAAERVSLTQSAVSHALAALESELGVMIIERNRKGVVALTPAGSKILPHARALLTQAEAIEQEAKAALGLVAGKLRLGNTLCMSPTLLARMLTCFEQRYPDVEVVLFEGTMQEVEEWIENSIVDVAIVPLAGTTANHTLILTDELYVVLASAHRLSAQSSVPYSELAAESFIMPKNDCTLDIMEMVGFERSSISRIIRYQASDSATILAMVREGLGVALLPRTTLPPKLEGLTSLRLNPPQYLEIGLAIKAKETTSPVAALFIETALDHMST